MLGVSGAVLGLRFELKLRKKVQFIYTNFLPDFRLLTTPFMSSHLDFFSNILYFHLEVLKQEIQKLIEMPLKNRAIFCDMTIYIC